MAAGSNSKMTEAMLLVVCLLSVVSANDVTTASSNDVTTMPQGLTLWVTERQTSSVSLAWSFHSSPSVRGYRLKCQKEDSDDIIYSPVLSGTASEYTMDNLVTSSSYTICLQAAAEGGKAAASNNSSSKAADGDDFEYTDEDCVETRTIPLIRLDSIIALLLAIGYILLMILIGYICWKCAKKRMEKGNDDNHEEDEERDKLKEPEQMEPPLVYSPAYMAPPSGGPVRSSIEDPDIPYITPPIDQLSQSDRQRYAAKV